MVTTGTRTCWIVLQRHDRVLEQPGRVGGAKVTNHLSSRSKVVSGAQELPCLRLWFGKQSSSDDCDHGTVGRESWLQWYILKLV
jgi:hypothetical protein